MSSSYASPERRDEGPGGYRMPFGVHKDKRLRELPVSYLEWLLGLDNLRDPLRTNLHDLVQHLHRLAGGDDVSALFSPDSEPDRANDARPAPVAR
jgi:hypothetical protein